MQQNNNSSAKILKLVSGVFLLTLLGKLLGFVRELLLSYYYGASGIVDAFLISQTIPGTIFQFVGTGLATCFIPIYYRARREGTVKTANKFVNKILTTTLLFSIIVILIVLFFPATVVKLFASGFEGQTLQHAITFTRIVVVGLVCSSFIYVFSSYLQANNRFNLVSSASVINGVIICVSIIVSAYIGVWILVIGSVFSLAIQAIFLWIPSRKVGLRIRPELDWKDTYSVSFYKLLIPVIIGVSITEINTLVDRNMASNLAIGGIAALSYANSLIMFAQGGLIQPITTIFYPKIAQMIANNMHDAANEQIKDLLSVISNVLLPVSFCFVFFSEPITVVVFGRGAFDWQAISMTSKAIQCYSIGIFFYGIREILARYFYAYSDTRTPMIASIIGMIFNIFMNILFSHIWGLSGLAIATSLSTVITVCLMWIFGKKKISYMNFEIANLQVLRSIIVAISSVFLARLAFNLLPFSQIINFAISMFVFLLLYFLVGLILQLKIFKLFLNILQKKKI